MRILQLALCTTIAALGLAQTPTPTLRLPDSAVPLSYQASLTLDPSKDSFDGQVRIAIELKQSSDTLWLNGNDITVNSAVYRANGDSYPLKASTASSDFLRFTAARAIPAGRGELEIAYAGKVHNNSSAGIFASEDNGNRYLYTQFEAVDARSAFPCFDEPSYKVPWQLSLTVPAGNTAVSNTPVARQSNQDGRTTYVFAQTRPLPSYLVAFGVGPFEYVDAGTAGKRRIPVRIVVPKGHADEAAYAVSVTATIITRLEDYFGMPFPYDKSDQLAVPVTFGFGAMENPGLVTYAQTILLAKPSSDSIDRQRGYAETAAHELAHQWFGDLVTTAWWDDIWLNEAFATWMEQKLIREWKPEWNTALSDARSRQGAKSQDSLVSARKIRQEIVTKADIGTAFDGITYMKGAAVITMFENWVGPDAFREGIRQYLATHTDRTATAGQFLDAISTASKRNVSAAFSTFLNQTGVPLVRMSLACKPGAATLHLDQERFVPRGLKAPAAQTWQVPVCIRYAAGSTAKRSCQLLTSPSQDWPLETTSCPAWVEGNENAGGYYFVDYQGDLLKNLGAADARAKLGAAERLDLISTASALSTAGKLPLVRALELAASFAGDSDRQVVETAARTAARPGANLVAPALNPNYSRFLDASFGAKARALGWTPKPGEDDESRLLRQTLLPLMATRGGDRQLAAEARSLASRWLTDHSAVDADLSGEVLQTAAYLGDKAFFDELVSSLKSTKNRQDRFRIIRAMSAFRNPEAVSAGFRALLDGTVSFIEGSGLLFGGQADEGTRDMALQFLAAHFDEVLAKRPTGGSFDLASFLPSVGGSYCDPARRKALRDFFEPRLDRMPGAPRRLAQVLEMIDACIASKAADEGPVAEFLKRY